MYLDNYEVEILVNGKPVREYQHQGRIFIEGRKSTEFKIRVRNNSSRRILAIPTVDGLSVIDGKIASHDSPGYVIGPYGCTTVDGWRISKEEAAKFFFTEKENSYSAKVEKGGNQGVIGVAVFKEKISAYNFFPTTTISLAGETTWKPWWGNNHREVMNVNCCLSASAPTLDDMDLGTGWGEKQESRVTSVDFERDSTLPTVIFEIYYASGEKLKQMGITVGCSEPRYISAFPGEFCQPPKK